MKSWLGALDKILRGEMTKVGNLQQSLAQVPIAGMVVLIIALGAIYGMGMGTFALAKAGGPSFAQFAASGVKIPLLFLLTLLVTFPSLYVFNALVGSRLDLVAVLRLLLASLGVTLAVLASFGPIVAFFSVSTTSYSFMVLLNVAVCTTAGVLGLIFLRQTLHRLTLTVTLPQPAPVAPPLLPGSLPPSDRLADDIPTVAPPLPPGSLPPSGWLADDIPAVAPLLPPGSLPPGPLDHPAGQALGSHVRGVFRCWMVLFALVGSQMGWVLRPFIGQPGLPFTFFRPRGDNFFIGVWEHVLNLFH